LFIERKPTTGDVVILQMTSAERRYVFGLLGTARGALRRSPSFPPLIELQTVNRCNARCPMCPYPATTATVARTNMDDDRFDHLLDQMEGEDDFSTLVLSFQNEPMVDARLLDRAARFKSRFPDKGLEMVTNGTLLTPDRAATAYQLFDRISISVNADDPGTYEAVMKGLSWDRVMHNLDHISTRPDWVDKTIIRFVKCRSNYDAASSFKRRWNRRGFRVFGFEINSRLGAVPDFEDISRPITASMRLRNAAFKVLGRALLPGCPIPSLTFYIRANGDVVLCFNDWGEENILGNVFETSIRDVFLSERYARFRGNARQGALPNPDLCEKCDLYRSGVWMTV